MATPALAHDWINGEFMCACEGNPDAFVNLATGEIQCAVTCVDSPECRQAWSFQDNQFNMVCEATP